MKMMICLITCLALAACGSNAQQEEGQAAAESPAHTESAEQAATAPADMVVAAGTYPVACGCSIESVGHCGNYIEVDSHFVEIANGKEMGLGPMAWCGQSGVTVAAAGKIEDGKFVATQLELQ